MRAPLADLAVNQGEDKSHTLNEQMCNFGNRWLQACSLTIKPILWKACQTVAVYNIIHVYETKVTKVLWKPVIYYHFVRLII